MNSNGYCEAPPISTNAGKPCQYKYDCPTKTDPNTFASCYCTFNNKEPRYCDILQGNTLWQKEFSLFKNYWNATLERCNVGARWDECGGKSLEYYEWQCAYHRAVHYVDYMYKEDVNFTKLSLDTCFEKYL